MQGFDESYNQISECNILRQGVDWLSRRYCACADGNTEHW